MADPSMTDPSAIFATLDDDNPFYAQLMVPGLSTGADDLMRADELTSILNSSSPLITNPINSSPLINSVVEATTCASLPPPPPSPLSSLADTNDLLIYPDGSTLPLYGSTLGASTSAAASPTPSINVANGSANEIFHPGNYHLTNLQGSKSAVLADSLSVHWQVRHEEIITEQLEQRITQQVQKEAALHYGPWNNANNGGVDRREDSTAADDWAEDPNFDIFEYMSEDSNDSSSTRLSDPSATTSLSKSPSLSFLQSMGASRAFELQSMAGGKRRAMKKQMGVKTQRARPAAPSATVLKVGRPRRAKPVKPVPDLDDVVTSAASSLNDDDEPQLDLYQDDDRFTPPPVLHSSRGRICYKAPRSKPISHKIGQKRPGPQPGLKVVPGSKDKQRVKEVTLHDYRETLASCHSPATSSERRHCKSVFNRFRHQKQAGDSRNMQQLLSVLIKEPEMMRVINTSPQMQPMRQYLREIDPFIYKYYGCALKDEISLSRD